MKRLIQKWLMALLLDEIKENGIVIGGYKVSEINGSLTIRRVENG